MGELIGWEHFSLIQRLAENRDALITAIGEAIQKARSMEASERNPLHGTSLSITTASEKRQKKRELKDRRKAKGVIGEMIDIVLC